MSIDRDAYGTAGASAERMARKLRQEHRRRQRRAAATNAPLAAAAASGLGWMAANVTDSARPGIILGATGFAFAVGLFVARSPDAARWGKGARGERATGRRLDRLPGWNVLHDRAVPGSRANLDHIVIGPGGVVYVDAKHWTARRVEIRHGKLWYGGDKTPALRTVLWEAGHVARALGGVPVRALVAFHGQVLPTTELHVDDQAITVLGGDALSSWFTALLPILPPVAVRDLTRRADTALPPHTA